MALVTAFVAAFGYGSYRLLGAEVTPGPRLAVVRPGIAHAGEVDLIVWPESAIGDEIDRNGAYLHALTWLGSSTHAPVLLGAQGRAEGLVGRTTNSAFLVDEEGALCGRYDKQLLFPYVEYVPYDKLAGSVDPAVQRAYRRLVRKSWGFLSNGTPGRTMTLFALPWKGGTISFAAMISMESSYPPLVAEASRRGARFLVNLSSEDEFSGVIQEQLLRVSMLRAVENRIGYLRATNTGISAFIDPRGRLRSVRDGAGGETTAGAGVLTGTVALQPSGPTAYAASHDAFALLCVAASFWLLARALLRGPATMTPHPVPAAATAT